MAKSKKYKIFCPVHKSEIKVNKDFSLVCGKDESFSSTESGWLFCCICTSFIIIPEEWNYKIALCPNCKYKIEIRLLCDNCRTIFFDNPRIADNREFSVKETGVLNSSCPNCEEQIAKFEPVKHNCERLGIEFFTSRLSCPFCREDLSKKHIEKIYALLEKNEEQIQRQGELIENNPNESKMELLEKSINDTQKYLLGILDVQNSNFEKLKGDFEHLNHECGKLKSNHEEEVNKLTEITNKKSDEVRNLAEKFTKYNSVINDYINNFIERQEETADNNNAEFFNELKELKKRISQLENQNTKGGGNAALDNPNVSQNQLVNIGNKRSLNRAEQSKTLQGLLTEIWEKFEIQKTRPLVHYPLIEGALKPASSSEKVVFHLLHIDEEAKDYALPASSNIQNESQFKQFAGIYKAHTARLNGKIYIVHAAEVQWDDEIHGFKCIRKGVIDIH